MKLLSLLLLVSLAIAIDATTIPEKVTDVNDAPEQAATDNQAQIDPQEQTSDKKIAKRSYGWNPWSYAGYSYGWPWYGPDWYPGWYPGWPLYYGHGYGGYGGYGGHGGHGGYGYRGWYKGW